MTDSAEKRKTIVTNLILIFLVLVLIFALYNLTGGDLFALIRPATYSGNGSDPISQLVGSLRSFGQGLQGAFRGLLR
jgi:cytochrome c biogenesis factor